MIDTQNNARTQNVKWLQCLNNVDRQYYIKSMHKRRRWLHWLDKVKDDIKEKVLSADDVYDRATSTPHKSGNKMKEKKKKVHVY